MAQQRLAHGNNRGRVKGERSTEGPFEELYPRSQLNRKVRIRWYYVTRIKSYRE